MQPMEDAFINDVTWALKPYASEQLAAEKRKLSERGVPIYDFGTGDPKIPLDPKINSVLKAALPSISQYPRAAGSDEFQAACFDYLNNRFSLSFAKDELEIAATRGSKEAIFHTALSVVGQQGRKMIVYPDPGYPVYKSSTLFAGGIPYPYLLNEKNNFLLEPWKLAKDIQAEIAAVWVNYPHNPTGKNVSKDYWCELISWAKERDVLILSDDCYVDLYDPDCGVVPETPLMYSVENVVAYFSLSKRSGMTGFRSGFMAGDRRFMKKHKIARANMGVGQPEFIEAAAIYAWRDSQHVNERQKIFNERVQSASKSLIEMGLLETVPEATFYLWCQLPGKIDDIDFCARLLEKGVVATPASWMGALSSGAFRLALVPEVEDIQAAMPIIKQTLNSCN